MARHEKKQTKDNRKKESSDQPQRRGSAFNEKPAPQPAHVHTGKEKKERIENNDQPPGIPGRDEHNENAI